MGQNKKVGLIGRRPLERIPGNIEPQESFHPEKENPSHPSVFPKKRVNHSPSFPNQMGSIKIPISTKNQLSALKNLTKAKFDYEIIQLLIDHYTNSLSAQDMRKFRLMTDDSSLSDL